MHPVCSRHPRDVVPGSGIDLQDVTRVDEQRYLNDEPVEACRAALVEPLTDDKETVAALMEVVNASLGGGFS